MSGAIFRREICHRPNGVELRFNGLRQISPPSVSITVYGLRLAARVYLYRLGEMQNDLFGKRFEKRFSRSESQIIQY